MKEFLYYHFLNSRQNKEKQLYGQLTIHDSFVSSYPCYQRMYRVIGEVELRWAQRAADHCPLDFLQDAPFQKRAVHRNHKLLKAYSDGFFHGPYDDENQQHRGETYLLLRFLVQVCLPKHESQAFFIEPPLLDVLSVNPTHKSFSLYL